MHLLKKMIPVLLLVFFTSLTMNACRNELIDEIELMRSEASSPVLSLTLDDETSLSQDGSLDFGQISLGSFSEIRINLKNTGKSKLSIDLLNIQLTETTGTDEENFSLVTLPEKEVAINGMSTITIKFDPVSGGAKSATLTIPSNDFENPSYKISVSGNGWAVILTTENISNINETTATGGGNIASDGGKPISDRGICWGTRPNPTVNDNFKSDSGVGTGSYSSLMTGLNAGTFYYVRAYASNGTTTGYGSQVSFTTKPATPSAPAVSAVGYAAGSGKLNTSWSSINGPSTYYDIYYSTTTTAPDYPNGPTDLTTTSCTLTGLTDYMNYYVWVRAKNASGTTGVSPSGTAMAGIPATQIVFDRSPQVLLFNTKETITASILPANATNPTLIWSTSDSAIATVDNGVITTNSTAGNVTITAAAGDGLGIKVDFMPAAKAFAKNTTGPAGGILIADNGDGSYEANGWRYLEMNENPIATKNSWNNGYNIKIPGAYSHLLGGGKENTDAIIAAQGPGNYKAIDCRSFTKNGYSDWYMPSAGEVNIIITEILGAAIPGHWGIASSSQYADDFRGCYTYCDLGEGMKWNTLPTSNSSADSWPVRRF